MEKRIPAEIIKNLRASLVEQRELFEQQEDSEHGAYMGAEKKRPWPMYDDDLEDIQRTFLDVLPSQGGSIKLYLKQHFGQNIKGLVGLEVGGPGSNLFGSFPEGFFGKTAGITVTDLRPRYKTEEELKKDADRNHSVIAGDAFTKKALADVDLWRQGQKIDFIISRMQGGWGLNTENLAIFAKYFERYYERLGRMGVMMIQTPFTTPQSDENLEMYMRWLENFKENYRRYLKIENDKQYALKIEKTEKSPDKIDVLNFDI